MQHLNPLFYSRERAIYLLVVDISQPPDVHRINYWFNNIASRAPGAVVRLVGTKIDGCKDGKTIRATCLQLTNALRKAQENHQALARERVCF